VCISARQSPQPLRLYGDVGRSVPLHVGGGPKLLLAYAPPEIVQTVLSGPLKSFNPDTNTRPQALLSQLERIRRAGINETRGDLDVGAFSIAAPVRDHSNAVIAALSIAGPHARLNAGMATRYKALVREHAAKLSQQLGWAGAM
jgi:IclR family KDG regulon transcriptional repressor